MRGDGHGRARGRDTALCGGGVLCGGALRTRPLKRGALSIAMLGGCQSRAGVAFGLHRRQASARVLLCLEVLLSACNRRLRRIELGGRSFGNAGSASSRYGLARIAHFLHGSAAAAGQAGDTDNYRNEAQHKGNGH
ncbi:MAG: hypothetical protein JWN43_2559 [Gammaproteobacteria bacterium]|nr:hypothetical protein [Gammaproteobacteria bacterium]